MVLHRPVELADVYISNPKPLLKGIEFRAEAAHSRRASEITDILEAVVGGKTRKIAIAREVGASVLYRNLSNIAHHFPEADLDLARDIFRRDRNIEVGLFQRVRKPGHLLRFGFLQEYNIGIGVATLMFQRS